MLKIKAAQKDPKPVTFTAINPVVKITLQFRKESEVSSNNIHIGIYTTSCNMKVMFQCSNIKIDRVSRIVSENYKTNTNDVVTSYSREIK